MDESHFDSWTRRRLGLAAGSLVSSLLTFVTATHVAAKTKRKKDKKWCSRR
jgi:hypothetical protein